VKSLLLLLDGAADEPVEALGSRTPLEAADLVLLHRLAKQGTVGWTKTVLDGLPVYPEVAALEVLGYDSPLFYTGRGAFRALGADIPLGSRDVAFTCAFLATDGERITATDLDLTLDEAKSLLQMLQEQLGDRRWHFIPLRARRHLVLWSEGVSTLLCPPPDELEGKPFAAHLPQGDREQEVRRLIYDALELLERHEINRRRLDEGKPPANLLWLYEPGTLPRLPSFRLVAGMIRADGITDHIPMRGLFIAAGIRPHRPPTISLENLRADYERLASFVVDLLRETDVLVVHLREADKAAHRRDPELKVFALRQLTEVFLPPVLQALEWSEDSRLLLLCTHRTSSVTGKHLAGEVPFLMLPRRARSLADEFHERAAQEVGAKIARAAELAAWLMDIPTPIRFR
jgi:2,3-bisphosphoglycerate-independent phosphoglycerate mutase